MLCNSYKLGSVPNPLSKLWYPVYNLVAIPEYVGMSVSQMSLNWTHFLFGKNFGKWLSDTITNDACSPYSLCLGIHQVGLDAGQVGESPRWKDLMVTQGLRKVPMWNVNPDERQSCDRAFSCPRGWSSWDGAPSSTCQSRSILNSHRFGVSAIRDLVNLVI